MQGGLKELIKHGASSTFVNEEGDSILELARKDERCSDYMEVLEAAVVAEDTRPVADEL